MPANKAKPSDRLVLGLNHEIRTAVNAILGLTELLLESPLTPEQAYHVNVARASADHLLTQSAQILDLARAELGSLQLRQVNFDLHETVKQAIDLLSILARYKGITLTSRISNRVPAAMVGDPERINQILTALVRNGIERMGKGEISVRVEHDPGGEQGATIKFSVASSGSRIPPIVVRQLFDGFVDPEATTPMDSGLAVTLSKHLVELMGGTIWVEDAPGPGTVFHFNVNLAPAQPEPVPGDCKAGTGARNGEHAPRILVAEDATDNLLLIRAFLKDEPWRIDSASNGRLALERALTAPYDLILMDLDMPGDGWVYGDPQNPELGVVQPDGRCANCGPDRSQRARCGLEKHRSRLHRARDEANSQGLLSQDRPAICGGAAAGCLRARSTS